MEVQLPDGLDVVLTSISAIRDQVRSGAYRQELPSVSEWGGAGLIISALEIDRAHLEGKVIVVTEHWREISWLLCQLRDACNPVINYLTKYSFYPRLGRKALACVSSDSSIAVDVILFAVLDEAAEFVLECE